MGFVQQPVVWPILGNGLIDITLGHLIATTSTGGGERNWDTLKSAKFIIVHHISPGKIKKYYKLNRVLMGFPIYFRAREHQRTASPIQGFYGIRSSFFRPQQRIRLWLWPVVKWTRRWMTIAAKNCHK